MRHLDTFAHAAKENGVVADNVSCTYRLDADVALLSLADKALAGIDPNLVQITIDGSSHHFGDPDSRPAGRILFQPMMGFDHLNIVLISKRPGHFADNLVYQVHSHTHVGRTHARYLACQRLNFLHLDRRKSCRADDDGAMGLGRSTEVIERGLRR